jgi:hypothetical protein
MLASKMPALWREKEDQAREGKYISQSEEGGSEAKGYGLGGFYELGSMHRFSKEVLYGIRKGRSGPSLGLKKTRGALLCSGCKVKKHKISFRL